MSLRVLPPARSALSLRAIATGARAAAGLETPALAALASELGRRTGCLQTLLTDSGTSALRLAIAQVGARAPDRPVALPAYACYDVLTAASGAGVPFVFYDIDPETLAPDAASLDAVARSAPAGIVLVHAYGVPVDLGSVRSRLPPATPLIEDAAQAWGCGSKGALAGTGGDFVVFSFGRGKGITGGSGGALLVREAVRHAHDDASPGSLSAAHAAGWRDVMVALALWTLARPSLYGIPSALPGLRLGETRFKPPVPVGAISRAAGAIVLATLTEADRGAVKRRLVADRLRALVESAPRLSNVRAHVASLPGWLRLPVLADNVEQRDRLVREGRALGVAAGYPRALPELARALGLPSSSAFRGAETLVARLFTLPTHDHVTDADLGRLERLVARC